MSLPRGRPASVFDSDPSSLSDCRRKAARAGAAGNSFTDRLVADELSASLGAGVIGRRIIVLESTRSTNDFLRQMLTPELPDGVVVFAEEQTAGRGQRANKWESASHKGLWFSFLLRPKIQLSEAVRLTNWAALAVADTLRERFALEVAIKPPNDVYIDRRKICGVLVETIARSGPHFAAIVGIGVNLNQTLDDFPEKFRERAGSVSMALGRKVIRSDFALALLRELERTRRSTLSIPVIGRNHLSL